MNRVCMCVCVLHRWHVQINIDQMIFNFFLLLLLLMKIQTG